MYSWPRLWNRLKLNPNTAGFWHVPASLANVKSVGFFLRVCFSLQLLPPSLPASWRTILATGRSHFAGGDFPMIKYSSTLSIESSWRCIVLRRRAAENIDARGKTQKDKNGWSYGNKLVTHFDKNSVVEKCIRCGFEFKYTHKWSGLREGIQKKSIFLGNSLKT